MKIDQLPVAAHRSNLLLEPLKDILNSSSSSRLNLKAGFAYATLGGVEHFISEIEASKKWKSIDKQFLIGIHHAITEPSALTLLNKFPNSQIRVYVPKGRLTLQSLMLTPLYHPKILVIEENKKVKFIQSGSTNLTWSAFSATPNNYEFSLAVTMENLKNININSDFSKWWVDLWKQSRVADDEFIDKYSNIREKILEQNPILQLGTEAAPSLIEARTFFIEVGAGSGPIGQRHQVEFPESLVKFFGQAKRVRRDLSLKQGQKIWNDRPLSYKQTTYHVDIWRLGMPTQNTGGEPIAERAIKFERTSDVDKFDFKITDVGSREYKSWVSNANRFGQLGTTHGGRQRQYGFY